jgi:hypothetical protein
MWNAGYGLLAVVGALELAAIALLLARAARGGRLRSAKLDKVNEPLARNRGWSTSSTEPGATAV